MLHFFKWLGPKGILFLLLAVLFLAIGFQNMELVSMQLFFWRIAIPKLYLLLGSFLLGAAAGYLLANLRKLMPHKKGPAITKPESPY